jgi:hypothetical protein
MYRIQDSLLKERETHTSTLCPSGGNSDALGDGYTASEVGFKIFFVVASFLYGWN